MDAALLERSATAAAPEAGDGNLLRFITCGSVDDGKSTLIGRLLYESKTIFEDQLTTLEKDSKKHGTTGEDIDFALLVDGLEAEREQGITIDVAYRFFATPKRSFIVADTPGHEQYTRNMATGASTADLAIILIDARKGVLVQTKRHAFICSLLGVKKIVLAVNKIDLMGYDQKVFDQIVADFAAFSKTLNFVSVQPIPLSARFGDNVTERSAKTSWYRGPSLIEYLEGVEIGSDIVSASFRFPVQYVNRPNLDFRGFAGTVASGRVRAGDDITVAGSGRTTKVTRIVTADGDLEEAVAEDAVTLVLAEEVDVARGDVLCDPKDRPEVTDGFSARVIWMSETKLLPGRSYMMRVGTRWVPATVSAISHKIDVNTLDEQETSELTLNEIALCEIRTATAFAFDAYTDNRGTGAFILVDRTTNETAAAGMIERSLRHATNVHREDLAVDKAARAASKYQKPVILWFTGLSGSGKSSVARLVEHKLNAIGHHTYMLDGDNIRHGLNSDLGFTQQDRDENIRRVGEVAKLFVDAGLIVICSFISPYQKERDFVRSIVEEGEFIEVFIDTPLEECERRDTKGLYKRARAGEIAHFTGISAPYEAPASPELHLKTLEAGADKLAERVLEHLREKVIAGGDWASP
ncbi:adenylyl-sulfate kinase [Terrihabitans soli]|uniref:Multifunctional fusion protein n=1 Tax=Terrihabitans soli TaxID=708113 RepID=A0A6S6QL45_9HYPH|nr:sulfate adenylyltransferase subunit CysN [Terrihabitans soli]BCJ92053.1 adenylyl-sulfate kinase [Terrihabitans soli]